MVHHPARQVAVVGEPERFREREVADERPCDGERGLPIDFSIILKRLSPWPGVKAF